MRLVPTPRQGAWSPQLRGDEAGHRRRRPRVSLAVRGVPRGPPPGRAVPSAARRRDDRCPPHEALDEDPVRGLSLAGDRRPGQSPHRASATVPRLNIEPILYAGLIPRTSTFRPGPDEAPRAPTRYATVHAMSMEEPGRADPGLRRDLPLSPGATWTRPPSPACRVGPPVGGRDRWHPLVTRRSIVTSVGTSGGSSGTHLGRAAPYHRSERRGVKEISR